MEWVNAPTCLLGGAFGSRRETKKKRNVTTARSLRSLRSPPVWRSSSKSRSAWRTLGASLAALFSRCTVTRCNMARSGGYTQTQTRWSVGSRDSEAWWPKELVQSGVGMALSGCAPLSICLIQLFKRVRLSNTAKKRPGWHMLQQPRVSCCIASFTTAGSWGSGSFRQLPLSCAPTVFSNADPSSREISCKAGLGNIAPSFFLPGSAMSKPTPSG